MAKETGLDIAVVGGGIIGISIALLLQKANNKVTLYDRDEPGMGCSFGNAGVIATSFIRPLSNISNLIAAPFLMSNSLSPLSAPIRYLPHYANWLMRFALCASDKNVRKSTDILKRINSRCIDDWTKFKIDFDLADIFEFEGMLDVIRTLSDKKPLIRYGEILKSEGIDITLLNSNEVSELEPNLNSNIVAGLFHRDVAHVRDPLLLSQTLLKRFIEFGGTTSRTEVNSIEVEGNDTFVNASNIRNSHDKTIVAAGWWSQNLLKKYYKNIPLRAERGYHISIAENSKTLTRPVSFHSESFLATPMNNSLRLAGTVELAPPYAEPNWDRANNLIKLSKPYLPKLDSSNSTTWVGSRPSFPDSLPAIGRVSGETNIYYAFGHQHLGLTQAATTAFIMKSLIESGDECEVTDLSLNRFG